VTRNNGPEAAMAASGFVHLAIADAALRSSDMRRLAFVGLSVLAGACALTSAPACSSSHASKAPPQGLWASAKPLPLDRFEAYAATSGGKIYYIGGITGIFGDARSIKESDRVDVYDPASDAWSDGPVLPVDAAKHHLAVAVVDEKIYVLGGFVGVVGGDPPGMFHPIATTFVLDGGAWRRVADQPLARGAATAQAIDGKIYVVGGGDNENFARPDLLVYDPATDAWSARASMPTAREHVASCAMRGKMIAVGGWNGVQKNVTSAAEIYDPSADTWTTLPDMPTPRGGLGGMAVGDVCYFIGGEHWEVPPPATYATNEGIDLASGTWHAYAPMPTSRHGIGVALLGGAVHVVGGGPSQGNSYTSVVEVFTP
jgi:N-acetylneuraminic acid mutarotase